MNLSQAIHYRAYPAAVCCLQTCYPYSTIQKRILAHVVKQGGRITVVNEKIWQVHTWYIVSIDHITLGDGLYYARNYPDDTKSYSTLDGCYQWLKHRKIDTQSGWYPAGKEERWIDLGAHH